MKIALIAFHFRPDEAIGAVRPENWAIWLADYHDVTVITREAKVEQGEQDKTYKVLRPRSLAIRLLDRFNARRKNARLRNVSKEVIKENPADNQEKTVSGAFTYRMPCLYDLWFIASYRALQKARPDLIIATHSPYVSIMAAYVYAIFNARVKIWLDFRDLWTKNHIATGLPVFSWFEGRIENRALKRADIISTVSNALRETLLDSVNQKVYTIYNCPARQHGQNPTNALTRNDALTFCYTGTIYNGWRDPSPLLEILMRIRKTRGLEKSECAFNLASKNPGNLMDIARRYGVEDLIDYKGSLSREASMQLQETSDVLVLLESSSPEAKGVLTGKVFEYLATDKPILLIGPGENSELYQLLKKHDRLTSLADIEKMISDGTRPGAYLPVDYTEISKAQVLKACDELTNDAH